jgi:hypothetical protein
MIWVAGDEAFRVVLAVSVLCPACFCPGLLSFWTPVFAQLNKLFFDGLVHIQADEDVICELRIEIEVLG